MTDPPRRRFTTREYHRMLEAGILMEGERVELLAGEIFDKAGIGSRHAACVRRLTRMLTDRLGRRAIVSVQNPVQLDDSSEPEPDVAVVRPRVDFYASAHPLPDDILLIVEVSDTTYGHDRHRKLPLYAEAGIGEAWIVRLESDEFEVYRDPAGETYRDARRARGGDVLTPAALPDLSLAVDDVLP